MLVLTRREGQGIVLRLAPDVTEAELQVLMTEGIRVEIDNVARVNVRIAIDAPLSVLAIRSELIG